MTEPLDISAMQQPVWHKETDVDQSDAARNSPRSWSTDLPSFVVEKIYLLLNRRDQWQMSMVCKNWAEEYKIPSIWRKFTFAIPSKNNSSDVCPEVRRAQIFGEMFQHVKIICKGNKSKLNKEISDQFLHFIETLTCRSKLLSFHIEIPFIKLNLDQVVYDNIFRSILHFVKSQKKMEVIRFINTYLEKSEIVQILEELVNKKPATLKRLHVIGIHENSYYETQDFFQNSQGFYDMLLNLECLRIDYSQIFERIILCLKDAIECYNLPRRQKPINFLLFFNSSAGAFYQGIESKSWDILSKHWPALKVKLIYKAFESGLLAFEKLIVEKMPLTSFDIVDIGYRVNDVFRHLISTKVCNFLEDIKITCKETTNFVQDLITLLLHSPNLKEVTTNVPLSVTALEFLFDFIAANNMRDQRYFVVKISGLSREVFILYMDVLKKYFTIMLEMGLKLYAHNEFVMNDVYELHITCCTVDLKM